MRPTSKQLAMRDPALAAIMGVSFTGDSDFGAEFGDDYGAEFGDDYGIEAAMAMTAPPAAAMAAAWKANQLTKVQSASRQRLLEPNRGSTVKVERYAFAINQALVLGVAATLTMTGNPDTTIRPQRVTMNAPQNGFATITEIKVANVSVTVGGIQDAFDYSALGVGQSLDMPTLSPANRATVLGTYTGFVPPGFVGGSTYLFCASFKGPSSIVA
jgi:hypothetical protein